MNADKMKERVVVIDAGNYTFHVRTEKHLREGGRFVAKNLVKTDAHHVAECWNFFVDRARRDDLKASLGLTRVTTERAAELLAQCSEESA